MKQDTSLKILAEAQHLLQLKGYNGFSYKDLAHTVGIKTSSIHYHYPTKIDLVIAVIDFYSDELCKELALISKMNVSIHEKLMKLIHTIFQKTFFSHRKMCVAGILAAEVFDLDPTIKAKLNTFFANLERSIVSVLKGRPFDKPARFKIEPKIYAKQLVNQIEGGLILARLFDDDTFLSVINDFISMIEGT